MASTTDSPQGPAGQPDEAMSAVVRRLGGVERQLDQVATRLAALEERIAGLATDIEEHLPRLRRDSLAAAAMVDAVAAQVAADTDAIARRIDRIQPDSRAPLTLRGLFTRRPGDRD